MKSIFNIKHLREVLLDPNLGLFTREYNDKTNMVSYRRYTSPTFRIVNINKDELNIDHILRCYNDNSLYYLDKNKYEELFNNKQLAYNDYYIDKNAFNDD